MRRPRGLTEEEQEAWARLASTVTPMPGRKPPPAQQKPTRHKDAAPKKAAPQPPAQPKKRGRPTPPKPVILPRPAPHLREGSGHLDTSWERKMARAGAAPDFTLDLHGHTLDAAYARLNAGLQQALSQGARLLLVVAGRPRPTDAADRGERRGAIRAKLLDWIAAGPYAGEVTAIRPAHPKHGGRGALYIVLRRRR